MKFNSKIIKQYLSNAKEMINDNNYTFWLYYLEKINLLPQIKTLISNNKLAEWENEILCFSGYYRQDLETQQFFAKSLIDKHWYDYTLQKNKLVKLVKELNVRYCSKNNASYIDSIVIRTKDPDDSITLTNYTLCYDIAHSLCELLSIPLNPNEKIPNAELRKPNTKKKSTYNKIFIENLFPFYLFLKENTHFKTDIKIYIFLTDFASILGFEWKSELPEERIKDIFKPLKRG